MTSCGAARTLGEGSRSEPSPENAEVSEFVRSGIAARGTGSAHVPCVGHFRLEARGRRWWVGKRVVGGDFSSVWLSSHSHGSGFIFPASCIGSEN